MPSYASVFRPPAPGIARPAAIRSRRDETLILRVLCTLAVMCVGGLAAGVSPTLAAFPGHNGKIAFVSDRNGGDEDIWTMSPNESNRVNLTRDSAGNDTLPNWRADGHKIVFSSNRVSATNPEADLEIFVMNGDGSNQTQITSNALDDEDPAWSADGRSIAFQRDFDPVGGEVDYDILTMNVDGTGEANLTNSPRVQDFEPNWSPNGRKIAFASDRDGDNEIYTMSPNGANVHQLTVNATLNAADDGWPNWSPDGRLITFNSNRDGNFEIYTMRADGGNPTRLTFSDANGPGAALAAWSPNGRKLAFSGEGEGGPDVFTMRADGGSQVNRTHNPAFDYGPDWQSLDHHDDGGNHGDDEDAD
jgi:Tol biopolymer transport system component